MPKNQRGVDRATKESAILDVAEEAFVLRGWDDTTMASIAADVGITPTAVYWYYPTKDDLLVAIVRRWAGVTLVELEELAPRLGAGQVAELIVAAVQQLRPLLGVLHERLTRSEAVARVHDELHQRLAATLAGALDAHVADCFVLLVEAIANHSTEPGLLIDGAIDGLVRMPNR